MSLIRMNFHSVCLNHETCVNVILPMPRNTDAPAPALPVLYLIHGMGDDETMWLRKTNVERFAIEHGIAVVMPNVAMSCCENIFEGERYRDFLVDELPAKIEETFPVSRDRKDRYIAGCSMGGCGAIKVALSAPGRFARVGIFSAGLFEFRPDHPINQSMLARVFGPNGPEAADHRDAERLDLVAQNGPALSVFHAWGDHDLLRDDALRTRDLILSRQDSNIEYKSVELPGRHDWALWDDCIRAFIQSLPENKQNYRLM